MEKRVRTGGADQVGWNRGRTISRPYGAGDGFICFQRFRQDVLKEA
ncbi:protein of unknown function [Kyrpidia spormannii]|uniref:Uncharacterized protein n=1 Tax=Kyrpidia spormannii TaxID=2055160 RepID=A0ACA8Z7R0_9BACL|nr:protein of unknown function [Kyrpidia spormannii]